MPGFSDTSNAPGIMYAQNVDFSGGSPSIASVTQAGQLLIGTGGSPAIAVGKITQGTGISVANGVGTIAIALQTPILVSNGGTGASTLTSVLIGNGTGAITGDSTNFHVLSTGLQLKGNNTNTTPPSGFIGEQIRSFINSSSQVSGDTGVTVNVTSISLTAGIWDVSSNCICNGVTTGTVFQTGITLTSQTLLNEGDAEGETPILNQTATGQSVSIPSYRILLSSTTTVYLVAEATYTVGAAMFYGRISATRVG